MLGESKIWGRGPRCQVFVIWGPEFGFRVWDPGNFGIECPESRVQSLVFLVSIVEQNPSNIRPKLWPPAPGSKA